jgi:DNA invertase Pin-like site-specific DNA recombinase
MMLEQQREGVAKAKAAGKYNGRKPVAEAIRQEVVRLTRERMTKSTIASQLRKQHKLPYRLPWQLLTVVPRNRSV